MIVSEYKSPLLKSSSKAKKLPSTRLIKYRKSKRVKGKSYRKKLDGSQILIGDIFLKLGISTTEHKGIKISLSELARENCVSRASIKRHILLDIANGLITVEKTRYFCKRTKIDHCGINIYRLTEKGVSLLKNLPFKVFEYSDYPNDNKKVSLPTLSTESITRKSATKTSSVSFKSDFDDIISKKKYKVLKKWKFLDISNEFDNFPDWFFYENTPIDKALELYHKKISESRYKTYNIIGWLTHVIRDGSCDYKPFRAKQMSRLLHGDIEETLKLAEISSSGSLDNLESLKDLKKLGLDIRWENMKKLMSKGFAHLIQCAKVLMIKIKNAGRNSIRNLNGYLHYLVNLKNPFDIFKKHKTNSQECEEGRFKRKTELDEKRAKQKAKDEREYNARYDARIRAERLHEQKVREMEQQERIKNPYKPGAYYGPDGTFDSKD